VVPDPLVGVVIPAYNAAEWVVDAIESVLAQRYRPVEIVVVDDGSTDTTYAVAAQRVSEDPDARVRVVSQHHNGVGAARNRALALIGGEFVAFHDADDLCTAESILPRVETLRARPEVDIVFGTERRFAVLDENGPVALSDLRPSSVAGSMLIRRAAFDRVGLFDENLGIAEGLAWLLRARDAGLASVTLTDQARWRRVHATNHSRAYRDAGHDLAALLKASLDRRRSGAA
jgi:glycosyltransferase involved in cell wall biosynthesis